MFEMSKKELFSSYVDNLLSKKEVESQLVRAVKGGYYEEVKFLYKKNPQELLDYPDILIDAVTSSYILKTSYKYQNIIKVIQFLTTLNEVEIDYQDKFGHTALIVASCVYNVEDAISILLEAGARTDIENNNGFKFN